MNILLDIIGSFVIGSMILLLIFNLNIAQSNANYSSDQELQLQQNSKTLADILEYDMRKIGYGYKTNPFIATDSNKIEFYADIDTNGTPDKISYLLSDTTAVRQTSNPNDRILYRIVNNDTSKGPSLGITNLKFSYMNSKGFITSIKDSIKYIKTEIWLATPEKVDGNYPFTYWEFTINPRNM